MRNSIAIAAVSLLVLAACQSNRQPGTTERPTGAVAPAASTQPVDSKAPAMIHFDQNNRE